MAVFRELLLAGSETFIRNQVDAFTGWTPTLFGLGRTPSALSRDTDVVAFSRATRLERRLFKIRRRDARVSAVLQGLRPQLVHAHFGMDGAMILPSTRRLGLPLVVTFHGVDVNVLPDHPSLMARLYRGRLPELFTHASALVAVSEFIASRLEALGAPADRIVVLPTGIPLAPAVDDRARQGVVFVGRLTEVKGASDAIRAYAALPDRIRDQHPLSIIGEGPLTGELERLSYELGADARFRGSLPPEAVSQALSSAAVFIGPSRRAADGATEALGTVFLEAGAARLPIIAYRSGGVPEAVLDGRSGLLAPEGDVGTLSGHLQSLLTNDSMRIRMGAAGRSHVAEKFDIAANTQRLEELYARVVSTHDRKKP
ncbi:MAG: glycosyltransferase [Microbacterium sp.]|uniref:glycosyltransferase n=1 Tax=Microbacterium sp. TaxID=51671 RepID=UPI003BAF4889